MDKEFVYETLKAYYAKEYSNFIKMKNAKVISTNEDIDGYMRGFCEVAMFAQYLGLTYEEVNELYSLYQEKFLIYKRINNKKSIDK